MVKNVIDIMGDYSSHGIKVSHPNSNKERMIRDWFENKIGGKRITERICNYLVRHGVVYIYRYTGKLKNEDYFKLVAASSEELRELPAPLKTAKKEIPYKYLFLNPTLVEPMEGALSAFADKPTYGVKLPKDVLAAIKNPKTDEQKAQVAKMPAELREAALSNKPVAIDPDKLTVLEFKKDDWLPTAMPLIFSCLSDINTLNKLKLADMCALDALSGKIRVWELGSLPDKFIPNPELFAAFGSMLEANTGGGATDIIWGPGVKLHETASDVHQFLGEDKYVPTVSSIYATLGLASVFGNSASSATPTSLKVFIERLQYLRDTATSFWATELSILQKGMALKQKPEVEFDKPILVDESNFRTLLKDLCDRNIVSQELVRDKLGFNNKMENVRLKREDRARKSGLQVPKAGPYFDPQPEEDLKKIALQSGQATPSEVGLELEEKKRGEKRMLDVQLEMKAKTGAAPPNKKKKPGQSGQGRPPGVKDKQKRKAKGSNNLFFWAKSAQSEINDILNPVFLTFYNKKNIRSLTSQEAETLENIKFSVLCSMRPFSQIDEQTVHAIMNAGLSADYANRLKDSVASFSAQFNRPPTIEEVREFQRMIVMELYADESV